MIQISKLRLCLPRRVYGGGHRGGGGGRRRGAGRGLPRARAAAARRALPAARALQAGAQHVRTALLCTTHHGMILKHNIKTKGFS